MSSSATNRSKLDMHSCLQLLTHSSNIHKVSLESLGKAVVLRHDGFSAILVYVKNIQNATPITNCVQSSRNLAQMMVRPGATKKIE